jgi:hypothetical protein
MSTTTDGKIRIEAEHLVKAPAADVYTYIADYREHHPRILPSAFSNLVVERGGLGSGTVFTVSLKLAGKTRSMRAIVEEPDPGSVIEEISLDNDLVTVFEVIPQGAATLVRIRTEWTPESGIAGWFERKLAPRMLVDLYREELINLDLYAGQHVAARERRTMAEVAG